MILAWLTAVSTIVTITAPAPRAAPIGDTLLTLGLSRNVMLDRRRHEVNSGQQPPASVLIRSASDDVWRLTSTSRLEPGSPGIKARLIAPEFGLAHNSDLPFSLNEGVVWTGRGLSTRIQVGAHSVWGPVTAVIAPQVVYSENAAFQTFSFPENRPVRERSALASPFHYPPHSMDLPQRPGTKAFSEVRLGESSLTFRSGRAAFGVATERQRWGPSIRNPLLMSGEGEGFGHLFVQTRDPLTTPVGSLHAKWILGRLEESDHFDFDPTNDVRSLSGAVVALTPSFDPGLSIGMARVVFAPARGNNELIGASLDFLLPVGTVASVPGDTMLTPGPDQLFSVFAHWVFPDAGFETWGEWGRAEEPRGLRDFLETPRHSRAYTLGVRHIQNAGRSSHFAVEAEHTSLEPSQAFRVRQHGEWYASRRVPQGYTHRGRVLGAGIGPSGSSQWLALDWLAARWHVGMFGTRIRWENEALHSYAPEFRRADLTLMGGIRGSGRIGQFEVEGSYASSIRLNYLFQTTYTGPNDYRGVDLRNRVARFTLRYMGG